MAWPKIGPYFWTEFLAGLAVLGGMILLIIPGLMFGVWFMFAGLLVITENFKGKVALSRSKQLVKGNFWGIASSLVILGFIVGAISLIFGFLLSFIFGKEFSNVGTSIASIFAVPFTTIFIFLIYEELKKIKG